MNLFQHNSHSHAQRIRTNIFILPIWFGFVVEVVMFIVSPLPYLLSPYVYITHNPVDDALVASLGISLVRPVLYLVILLGGIIGLILYIPVHRLYTRVFQDRVLPLGTRHIFLLIGSPMTGMACSLGLQSIWNKIIPYPNTGDLMSLFILLPGTVNSIVGCTILLVEYYRARHLAKSQGVILQFTRIPYQNHSERLELVSQTDGLDLLSTSHSITAISDCE